MPFSIEFDTAIMYSTKPFIHSEHIYWVLIIVHTVLIICNTGANNADQKPYPHGGYIAVKETDINKIKSKLQGMLDNNKY